MGVSLQWRNETLHSVMGDGGLTCCDVMSILHHTIMGGRDPHPVWCNFPMGQDSGSKQYVYVAMGCRWHEFWLSPLHNLIIHGLSINIDGIITSRHLKLNVNNI